MDTKARRSKAWDTEVNPSTHVHWDSSNGWSVNRSGNEVVLPEGPHPYEREWRFAVYAWQEAMGESFHQLNKEVQALKKRVAALKPKARR